MRSYKAFLGLVWMVCVQMAWSQTIPQVALEGVQASQLPGDRVRIALRFSHPPPKPRIFTLKEPPRIVLDFPHVVQRLPKTTQRVGLGMAEKVSAVEAAGRTRVVVSLIRSVPYDIEIKGNRLWLTLEAAPETVVAGVHRIENVDFRRRRGNVGEVIVTFSDAAPPADLRQEGEKIVAEFVQTELPKRLERRLDVEDFATPVRWVDTFKKGDKVRIEVFPEGLYEYFAYQSERRFVLAVRPLTPEEKEARKKQYTGEKLSLNFQDIDVRAVLAILGDFTGLNIVASDSVRGTITLRLQEVPWDQALDLILQAKGLGKRREGNVIWVAPLNEIAAFEQAKKRAQEETRKALPLRTELIQINYAKASEIAELLKAKLISERGSVVVDGRTNTLLIQETAPKLSEIRKIIAELDKPVPQVLIDARIVIANKDFARDLGARFGVTTVDQRDDTVIVSSGSAQGTDSMITNPTDGAIANIRNTGQPFPISPPAQSNRFNINMPATPTLRGTPGSLAFAILGADYLLDLELSALQAEGKGEVLSNPRVITADQQEAEIKQGTEIPYQEATSAGATSVSFKEAVLSLKVTPHITPDDRILMDLVVKKQNVGQNVPTGTGGFVPSIDTRQVTTQVLVKNGETLVLGGIFEEERRHEHEKVPLIGDIPVLGHLFKRTSQSNQKKELLIFVTPRVVKEGLKLPSP